MQAISPVIYRSSMRVNKIKSGSLLEPISVTIECAMSWELWSNAVCIPTFEPHRSIVIRATVLDGWSRRSHVNSIPVLDKA